MLTLFISRPRIAAKDALVTEQLVPIRLEFDVEHQKMRDTFVWNLNGTYLHICYQTRFFDESPIADPVITPEIFAQSIVDDYALAQNYHAIITKAIQDQLSDYKAHSTTFGGDADADVPAMTDEVVLQGEIDAEDEAAWWETWRKDVRRTKVPVGFACAKPEAGRKRRKVVKDEAGENAGVDMLMGPPPEVPVRADEFEEDESKMREEMRILIKVRYLVFSGLWVAEVF